MIIPNIEEKSHKLKKIWLSKLKIHLALGKNQWKESHKLDVSDKYLNFRGREQNLYISQIDVSDKYLNFKGREQNLYISEWKYYWGKKLDLYQTFFP